MKRQDARKKKIHPGGAEIAEKPAARTSPRLARSLFLRASVVSPLLRGLSIFPRLRMITASDKSAGKMPAVPGSRDRARPARTLTTCLERW